ncbi:MAG: hypothetical protein ACSLFI_07720 [Solirubrobacterales bacterium]
MGIDLQDPDATWEEVDAGIKARMRALENFDAQLGAYHGSRYVRGGNVGDTVTDTQRSEVGHAYQYIALLLPRIAFANPRVKVASMRGGPADDEAEAQEAGLNRWVNQTRLKKTVERVGVDMALHSGTMMSANVPKPGQEELDEPINWPRVFRVSPRRRILDPAGLSLDEMQFSGHCYKRRRKDLLDAPEGEGWNREEIEEAPAGGYRAFKAPGGREQERDELWLADVWIPGERMDHWPSYWSKDERGDEDEPSADEGYNGAIVTYLMDSGKMAKLSAEPWWGTPRGPYTDVGGYYVPDEVESLSPITATWDKEQWAGVMARTLKRAMMRRKKYGVVDTADAKANELLMAAQEGSIVAIDGVKQILEQEVGGPTAAMVSALQMAMQDLQLASGVSEAHQGLVSGRGTATEVAVADASINLRVTHLVQKMYEAVQDVLYTVGWWLYYDDRIVFPVGKDATGRRRVFKGGPTVDGMTFEDLELLIEPYSMERTTEQNKAQKALAVMQFLQMIAPMIPTMPYVDWNRVLDLALPYPELTGIIDLRLAGQVGAIQAQLEALKAAGQGAGERPRYGRSANGRLPQRSATEGGSITLSGRSAGSSAASGGPGKPSAARKPAMAGGAS